MIRPILAAANSFLQILWRRRWLLILPILISIPLSVLAAFIVPTVYVSKALLLLQESATDNLAPRETVAYGDTMRDRIAGLQAFMRSEHILIPVIEATFDHHTKLDSRRMAMEIDSLRRRLSLELIGNDFLQFQIRGSRREELRPILESIISRFLGSLIAPEETVLSATQMIKDRSAKEFEAAQRKLADAEQRMAELSADPTDAKARDALKREVHAKTQDLRTAGDAVAQARSRVKENVPGPEDINREIETVRSGPVSATGEEEGDAAAAVHAKERLDALVALREAYQARDKAQSALDQAAGSLRAAEQAILERSTVSERLTQLRLQRDEAKRLNEMYTLRFSAPVPRLPLHILKGPERIRVIDPPKDPDLPLLTKRTVALAGLLAGVLIAVACAVSAELLDPRVWRIEEFNTMTGLIVLAQIPGTALVSGRAFSSIPAGTSRVGVPVFQPGRRPGGLRAAE